MPVSIRVVHLKLVNIDRLGNIVDKNSASTTLDMLRRSVSKDFRIIQNDAGAAESPNASGFPTIEAYLALEAADNHALAFMDQTRIITQEIT